MQRDAECGRPGAVADNAREWAARGFETFKLKVGMEGDVEQVPAVREAVGPQSTDPRGRQRQLARRQPRPSVCGDGAARAGGAAGGDARGDGCIARRTDVRLSADESVVTAEDAEAAARVCDAATVKLAKVGGPRAAMRIAERIPVYLSSALDGPVGIAAAGHVAQAIPDCGFAHGLATSLLFADTVATRECTVEDGHLHLPAGPGWACEIDEDALARAGGSRSDSFQRRGPHQPQHSACLRARGGARPRGGRDTPACRPGLVPRRSRWRCGRSRRSASGPMWTSGARASSRSASHSRRACRPWC